jgi:hypothetical protein
MARPKKGTKENPVTEQEVAEILEQENVRPYKIMEAQIKDDFCNYKFEMTQGKGPYDIHKVDGKGIIMDEMRDVFKKFKVHLAAIYGAFSLNGVDVADIDQHHNDDITAEFHVSGFKIKGSGDMESIILIGSKYIPCIGGRMGIDTPPIPMDALSSYKWYNELKVLADKAREEVALYKEGNYIVVDTSDDEEEEKPKKKKAKQLTIASPEARADNPESEQEDPVKDAIEETDVDDDFDSPL